MSDIDWVVLEAGARLNDRPGGRHPAPEPEPAPAKPGTTDAQRRPTPALVSLHAALQAAIDAESQHGETLWARTVDWERQHQIGGHDIRGGGPGPELPDDVIEDRAGDAAASRYNAEVRALAKRMVDDATRWVRITQIVVPAQPRRLQGKDMLTAQVAADGWCVSCWRDDQTLVPIAVRTSGPAKGTPYYKDLCRFCGGWKAEHGQVPSLDVVRRHHDGRRIQKKAG